MGAKSSKKTKCLGVLRVLILGTSGSGKSTFAKQMKIIHQGFTSEEINSFKYIIQQNLVSGIQEVLRFTESNDDSILSSNRKLARYFKELVSYETKFDPATLNSKLKTLWSDPAVQRTWKNVARSPLHIVNLDYFVDSIDRITDPVYEPTFTDILMARQRTTGASMTTFVKDKYQWELVDVGGQKPEREKWDKIIKENALTAVIFFAALDEYNISSTEEQTMTKMMVVKEIFCELTNGLNNNGTSVLLFLNKMDLFTKKIENVGDDKDFEDFKSFFGYGGARDAGVCAKKVRDYFLDGVEEGVDVHSHVTCAVDTSAMTMVFSALKEDLYSQRLGANRPNIV